MPVNTAELLEAAELVAANREMKATMKGSLYGAGIAAVGTFVGGILLGPPGLIIGAITGGVCSFYLTKNKFKPLIEILRKDLTQGEKEKLAGHLSSAIKDFDIHDAVHLIAAIYSQEALILVFITTIKKFIEEEHNMKVTYI